MVIAGKGSAGAGKLLNYLAGQGGRLLGDAEFTGLCAMLSAAAQALG